MDLVAAGMAEGDGCMGEAFADTSCLLGLIWRNPDTLELSSVVQLDIDSFVRPFIVLHGMPPRRRLAFLVLCRPVSYTGPRAVLKLHMDLVFFHIFMSIN